MDLDSRGAEDYDRKKKTYKCTEKGEHKRTPCEDEMCDIIASIALTEAALAHILNAEGEKLQKAVEVTSDICRLLKVNESVLETIMNVTHLEHILFLKLTAILKNKDMKLW